MSSVLSYRSQTQSARSKNPFKLPPAAEMFSQAEEKTLKRQEEREKIQHYTLAQRVEMMQTPIPPCRIQRVRSRPATRETEVKTMSENKRAKTARGKRVEEFITEKREIYLTQLLIDKKTSETGKIYKSMSENDKKLIEQEDDIQTLSDKIKYATQQVEVTISRARRDLEVAIQNRVEKTKKLRFQQNKNNIIKADITKNQDTLEIYQGYMDFMSTIIPDGKKLEDCYKDYDLIPEHFDKIEKDNLFIQIQCQRIEELDRRGVDAVNESLADNQRVIEQVKTMMDNIEPIPPLSYEITKETIDDRQNIVKEINRLTKLVHRTYVNCFGEDTKQSAVTMLTKLESSLNQMYHDIEYVNPSFVSKRIAAINIKRRNEARKLAQEEKDRILAEKKSQALQRATKPAKKKTGRPLYVKTAPYKKVKRDDDREKELIRKRKQLEYLLYGPALE